MDDQKFTLEFHHGGLFAYIPQKIYASGKVELIEDVDPDRMSYFEILGEVKQLGCPKISVIYHRLPDCDLDGGLREIKTDADVLDMFAIHVGRSRIPIYVENPNLHVGDDEDMVSLGDKEDRVSLGDKEEDSDGDSDFHASSDCGSFSESDLEYFADGDMIFDEYENVGKGKKEREIKGKGKCFEIGSGSGKGKGSK
ncbi:hypothetical protein RHGRI_033244 [Rhododendron griersonianum]|uniref:PB1-like domain-containing protein n=1 Tax=Rhododendron griersonianum TaxID=479676 RepID=A0AAV6HZ43_9ERIC|nr:hypothetical protein RHGRI_033244 [Rhododendron griersonianum]